MGQRWTEDEIEIIRKYYPEGGSEAVKEHLPDRPIKGIRQKACLLGVSTKGPAWTKEDIEILKECYSTGGAQAVKERLSNRSEGAIFSKAAKLSINNQQEHRTRHEYKKRFNKKWTEEELTILKEFYPTEGNKVAMRLPDRTSDQCRAMARHKGFKREN